MATRIVKPSARAVARARDNAYLSRLTEDEEYFRVDVFRRNKLVFFYGGYYVQFEPYEGRIVRCGRDFVYLAPLDYLLMFRLATMLFKARHKGDQEARHEKAAGSKKHEANHEQPELFPNLPKSRRP